MSVSTLWHIVGISERGLRNAFDGVRRMSPKCCLVAGRLQLVRYALIGAPPGPGAVTSVALRYGFHELARFAGGYIQAFGETPSETLQSVGRKQVRGTAAGA